MIVLIVIEYYKTRLTMIRNIAESDEILVKLCDFIGLGISQEPILNILMKTITNRRLVFRFT